MGPSHDDPSPQPSTLSNSSSNSNNPSAIPTPTSPQFSFSYSSAHPSSPAVNEYVCQWADCMAIFGIEDMSQFVRHVTMHTTPTSRLICLWRGCVRWEEPFFDHSAL